MTLEKLTARVVRPAGLFLIIWAAVSSIPALIAKEPPGPAPAPIPAQIIAAKRVFISNGGEDTWLTDDPKHDSTVTYNEFYAEMKNLGKYDLVSSPSDADVVFEIRLVLLERTTRLRLLIIDPKTHITLWTLNQAAIGANRDATAVRNLDQAMTSLVRNIETLVSQSKAD